MRLRRMLVALFAITALAAVAAGGAQAAQWKISGNTFTGTESVNAARHSTVPLTFHSELLGLKVTLTANTVSCVGCTITGGGTKSAGKLKFTGISVDVNEAAAPKCTVSSGALGTGEVETNALVDEVIMDAASEEHVFDKFSPATSGGAFVKLKFGGAECALLGQEPEVFGTACGEAVRTEPTGTFKANKTGEEFSPQTLLFGEAQQTTGGCSLLLGKKAAQLTGAVDNTLSGARAGQPFGVG